MVFAKAPVPGQAKTRLIPAVGPEGAARLQAAFLRDVLERHARPHRRTTVWCSGAHPLWATLGVPLALQPAGDLGVRQAVAFAAELAEGAGASVVVVGTDSPTLPPELVDLAFATLAASEGPAAVVGPARDGGYYLLGLRGVDPHVLPAVFAGIAWGTPTVCAELMAGLRGAGGDPAVAVEQSREGQIPFEVLPFWYDIDTPEDLEALTTRRFLLSPPLPHHTLATLDELL